MIWKNERNEMTSNRIPDDIQTNTGFGMKRYSHGNVSAWLTRIEIANDGIDVSNSCVSSEQDLPQ